MGHWQSWYRRYRRQALTASMCWAIVCWTGTLAAQRDVIVDPLIVSGEAAPVRLASACETIVAENCGCASTNGCATSHGCASCRSRLSHAGCEAHNSFGCTNGCGCSATHQCQSGAGQCGSCADFCVGHEPIIQLKEFNIYPTFSYLRDQVGNYTEFEFATETDLGWLEMENRTVLNVADLPSTINLGPTNPSTGPATMNVRGNGFGDILSGFFFSRKSKHKNYHLGIGPVITFPTASNGILGSDQYTLGPGVHFSTELERLTAGFFLWQSWKVGGGNSQKRVNQLFGKPFIIYELTEKWHLVYIPLGMSHSWEAASGVNWTVPVGGGLRRLFEIRGQKMGFQMQAFDYVARKSQDPEWELRFTIEFLYD